VPSLFETRRRLPTSATNVSLRRAGNPTGALDPRRDGDRNLLPFLTRRAASLARASTRGEPRSVRSFRPRCRFLSVARVCPTAMSTRTRHLSRLSPAKCSDDRRARVCGPSEGRHLPERERLIALDLGCMRFVWRMPTPFPSSGTTGHPLSPARPSAWEEPVTDCRPPA